MIVSVLKNSVLYVYGKNIKCFVLIFAISFCVSAVNVADYVGCVKLFLKVKRLKYLLL